MDFLISFTVNGSLNAYPLMLSLERTYYGDYEQININGVMIMLDGTCLLPVPGYSLSGNLVLRAEMPMKPKKLILSLFE